MRVNKLILRRIKLVLVRMGIGDKEHAKSLEHVYGINFVKLGELFLKKSEYLPNITIQHSKKWYIHNLLRIVEKNLSMQRSRYASAASTTYRLAIGTKPLENSGLAAFSKSIPYFLISSAKTPL